jgi:L-alanine-DL-glutamate epimerase-like enolase superfamily enzyme
LRKEVSDMPVTSVLASTAVVPLDAGIAIATRAVQNREYTLVRVKNSSGLEGVGFCYGGSRAGHLSTIAVRDLLRSHVIGKETQDVEAIWYAMF